MIQVGFRSAKLTATFHEEGMSDDYVVAVAQCGDLRIEIEVPYHDWPQEEDGFGDWRMAKTAEVELT